MANEWIQYKPLFERFGCEVKADEPMKNHTSFKIGGCADLFVTVSRTEELFQVIRTAGDNRIPLFILGNGSNLLVSDKGIRGIVLKLGGEFCDIGWNEDGTIRCGAGAQLSKLCAFALEHSLTGLEFAWGIPGSCGGAAFMDAGAYGGEMKDVVTSCEHIDLCTGEAGRFEGEELDFAYRHSVYSGGGYVIDTPGIRGFGLVAIATEELSTYFPEMLRVMDDCRFKPCTHTHEPGCAVKQAVDEGRIAPERYSSYLGMLEEEKKYR